jgi:hypothetical protein
MKFISCFKGLDLETNHNESNCESLQGLSAIHAYCVQRRIHLAILFSQFSRTILKLGEQYRLAA